MLLDKLLSNLAVHVEPFALCMVSGGKKLPLPGPPTVMLHFVLRGSGAVRTARGEAYPLAPMWLCVVPTGVAHVVESTKNGDGAQPDAEAPEGTSTIRRIVVGSPQHADLVFACGAVRVSYGDSLNLFDHLKEILSVDLSGSPVVLAAFQGILMEQSRPGPGSETMTAALMSQCLVHLLRKLSKDPESPLPWLKALEDQRLARAIDKVIENPASNHSVESLAEIATMSRSAFAERFAETFGCSPMSLVQNVRMQRAAQLLRQGALSMDEVAARVGFSSRSHFSQAFKKHSGVSPVRFRGTVTEAGRLALG